MRACALIFPENQQRFSWAQLSFVFAGCINKRNSGRSSVCITHISPVTYVFLKVTNDKKMGKGGTWCRQRHHRNAQAYWQKHTEIAPS